MPSQRYGLRALPQSLSRMIARKCEVIRLIPDRMSGISAPLKVRANKNEADLFIYQENYLRLSVACSLLTLVNEAGTEDGNKFLGRKGQCR